MSRGPSDAGVSRDGVRRMFDGIAERYDRMNHLLSLGLDRRWRREAVAALGPHDGGTYLDIGCGTGDVALEILGRCPGASVVGADLSPAMLAVAARKAAAAGKPDRLSLLVADGTALPFADGSFAGVATAFCIRNVADRPAALAEMRRVVAPGGNAVLLELTVPPNPLVRLGHTLYLRCIVPLLGRLLARREDAYQYLADSIRAFPSPESVVAMMGEAGFASPCCRALSGGIVALFAARVR